MKITKYGLLSIAAVLTVAFTLNGSYATVTAVAHDGHDHGHNTTATEARMAAEDRSGSDAQANTEVTTTERREAASEKLSAAKLKACEKHQQNISNRMTKISERATKHLELFTTISERAQKFYTDKGVTLGNYDELVAAAEAKKAAAESTISSLTSAKAEFTCDSANPKQAVEEFRTSLKSTITALKEYRTAVKDLIVGIKSVNSNQTSETNTTEDAE